MACAHSGVDGMFCGELFTTKEDKAKHRIVWLPQECFLEAALRQGKRVFGSVGLVVHNCGLGVRVIAAKQKDAATMLMGEDLHPQ